MKKLKFTQAFTLIELLAVMVILMIVVGMIVGVGRTARRKAMETKAQAMIAALEVALSMYHTDTGQYPPEKDSRVTLTSPIAVVYAHLTDITTTIYGDGVDDGSDDPVGGNPEVTGWRGPYMEFKDKDLGGTPTEIRDPWNRGYYYTSVTNPSPPDPANNTNSFDLWSIGADGPDGTSGDDITNW